MRTGSSLSLDGLSMLLRTIIVLLLIAMIASLASGAVFFFKDQGESKRTLHALGVRIGLAVLLIICITYGVLSGELGLNAPWHP
jgi:ABC-type sulfate transport system permease component